MTPREQLAAELFRDAVGKAEATRYDTAEDIKKKVKSMARGAIWFAEMFFDLLEEQRAKESTEEQAK